MRQFGNWGAAVKAAGYARLLPLVPRPWPRSELLQLLRRIVKRHGYVNLNLLRRYKRRGYVGTDYGVLCLFGSLEEALKRARITSGQKPSWIKWSPARILKVIRQRARQRLPVNATALYRIHAGLPPAAARAFGSWPETLSRAGLDPLKHVRHRHWDPASVIQAIRRIGRPVIASEILRMDPGLHAAALKYFGRSCRTAIEKASRASPRIP